MPSWGFMKNKKTYILLFAVIFLFIIIIVIISINRQKNIYYTEKPSLDEITEELSSNHQTGGSYGFNDQIEIYGFKELYKRGLNEKHFAKVKEKIINRINQYKNVDKILRIQKKSVKTFWCKNKKNYYCYDFNLYYNNKNYVPVKIERHIIKETIEVFLQ